MSAAYLTLRNSGAEAVRLLSVELPRHPRASAGLHSTVREEGVSRMRRLPAIEVPARGNLVMEPGGLHLMLHDIQLRAGETLPLRLHFADGQVVDVALPVRAAMPGGADGAHHHHG